MCSAIDLLINQLIPLPPPPPPPHPPAHKHPRQDMHEVAEFRSKGRLPVLTYLHPRNGAAITRCAQPGTGIGGNRCAADENLLHLISRSNANHRHAGTMCEEFGAVGGIINVLEISPLDTSHGAGSSCWMLGRGSTRLATRSPRVVDGVRAIRAIGRGKVWRSLVFLPTPYRAHSIVSLPSFACSGTRLFCRKALQLRLQRGAAIPGHREHPRASPRLCRCVWHVAALPRYTLTFPISRFATTRQVMRASLRKFREACTCPGGASDTKVRHARLLTDTHPTSPLVGSV